MNLLLLTFEGDIMAFSQSNQGLNDFFHLLGDVLAVYQQTCEGVLVVKCKKGVSPLAYKLFLYGAPGQPCQVSQQQLETYAHQRNVEGEGGGTMTPQEFVECEILRVLTTTGHGTVSLEFQPRRGKVFVVGEVSVSHRWALATRASTVE
jgi:hypothetical protein